jgi:hypothetical protein
MAERSCECPQWVEWANDPFFPVWYNPRMNEYVLISGKLAADCTVIYYCVFCGGSRPKSRRGEFFTMPSDEDLAVARTLLQLITDTTIMRSILGEPDEIFDWWTDDSGELTRHPDAPVYKRQYRYRSRWRTLQVTIQEFEDGHLRFALSGQPKGPDVKVR